MADRTPWSLAGRLRSHLQRQTGGGDVVFVELPEEGATFDAGESFGTVESVKAVSDLYTPVGGEVVEVNSALEDAPENINEDPYGEGWIVKLRTTDGADLLSPEELSRARHEALTALGRMVTRAMRPPPGGPEVAHEDR